MAIEHDSVLVNNCCIQTLRYQPDDVEGGPVADIMLEVGAETHPESVRNGGAFYLHLMPIHQDISIMYNHNLESVVLTGKSYDALMAMIRALELAVNVFKHDSGAERRSSEERRNRPQLDEYEDINS